MKAKFLTVLVWGNLFVNEDLDSTDRIMNSLNLHLEAGGYKDSDHPTPLKFYLCQYEPRQPLKRPATGLAPSTGSASRLTPSVVLFDAKTHQRIVLKRLDVPFMMKILSRRSSKQPETPQKVSYKHLILLRKSDNIISFSS